MSLATRLREDLAGALKSRDLVRATTLRMLLSSLKNAEIAAGRGLSEDEELAQVTKAVKVRREAIEGAEKAGRGDLKAKEEAELSILNGYLPAQLDEKALAEMIEAAVAEAGAAAPSDMGKVMKLLMPRIAGRADGGAVSRLVRQKLTGTG